MIPRKMGLAAPGVRRLGRQDDGYGLVAAGSGRRLSRRRMLSLAAGAAVAGVAGFEREASAASKRKKLIKEAKKHLGKPYKYAGQGPNKFDCSGFTHYVVKQALGKYISPGVIAQSEEAGRKVSKKRRKKGDLIYFNLEGGKTVTHVAFYLGRNKVIHAMNPKKDVCISNISDPYWKIKLVRRM